MINIYFVLYVEDLKTFNSLVSIVDILIFDEI